MNPTTTLYLSLGAAALAVLYGIFTVRWVLSHARVLESSRCCRG